MPKKRKQAAMEVKSNKDMKKYAIYNAPEWWLKKYDGRRKEFKGISRDEFTTAKEKAYRRRYCRPQVGTISALRRAYNAVLECAKPANGNYQKVAMYGFTHLYLCSPIYGHRDYNKSRLYPLSNKKACAFAVYQSL